MDKSIDRALVWMRRDLRADDHAALCHALRAARQVHCAFVFDTDLLDPLLARGLRRDRRVEFIRDSVVALGAALQALGAQCGVAGAGVIVRHGRAVDALPRLAEALHVQAVYANHDDDPQALARDAQVRGTLAGLGIALHTSKDHVVFERGEVLTQSGKPFEVFTPYRNAWLRRLDAHHLHAWPVERHAGALAPLPAGEGAVPTLAALGFEPADLAALQVVPGSAGAHALLADFLHGRIERYDAAREFPAVKGPSYLGVHLRFGTLSIRRAAREAWARQADAEGARTWLSELAWRDFWQQLLHHHPYVVGQPFRREYEAVRYEHGRRAEALFAAWAEGRTGYPLVDAGLRQLLASGYMHNRLRMLTASFLVKDLGIDWRRGEQHFAEHLIDFELASNNGNWQWAAGCGCDAQPWFRLFNPVRQSERFDREGRFIRRYVPELARLPDAALHAPWRAAPIELQAAGVVLGRDYPAPLVDHDAARARTLQRYAGVKRR